jgi:hypothetical protein
VSRTAGGTTTSYVWDIGGSIPHVLDDSTQYVYAVGLVSRITGTGTYYYLADGLGSTVAVVDGSGTTVASYSYDVFGRGEKQHWIAKHRVSICQPANGPKRAAIPASSVLRSEHWTPSKP